MIGFSKFSAVTLGVFNSQVEDTLLSSSLAQCTPDVTHLQFSVAGKKWTAGTAGDVTKTSVYAKCEGDHPIYYKCESAKWKACTDATCKTTQDASQSAYVGADDQKASKALLTCDCQNYHLKGGEVSTAVSFDDSDDAQKVECNAGNVWYSTGSTVNNSVKCDANMTKFGNQACVKECKVNGTLDKTVEIQYNTAMPTGADIGKIKAKLGCKEDGQVLMVDALESNDEAECTGSNMALSFNTIGGATQTIADVKCDSPEEFCAEFTGDDQCTNDHFNDVKCYVNANGTCAEKTGLIDKIMKLVEKAIEGKKVDVDNTVAWIALAISIFVVVVACVAARHYFKNKK
jgi:hypothetical protein